MAAGTNRDNPPMPFTDSVLRRWLVRQGFRNTVFDTDLDLPGLVPSSNGVTSTWVLQADGTWAAPSSGGEPSDGDKGDITVTASGLTWTIDDEVVTYAKMQHTSGTDVLLGRSTAGAGDVEEITCTAAGRAILDDADAEAQRTTLSAQESSSNLDALALITIAADQSIYGTADGVWAKYTLTSFGRSLMDDADASAGRTTLGLGDLAVEDVVPLLDSEAGAPVRTMASTALTDVYSHSIPANTLGNIRLTLLGDLLQNESAQILKFKVLLGGTAVWGTQYSASIAQDADRRPFRLILDLVSTGTGTQHLNFDWTMGVGAAAGSGIGRFYSNEDHGIGSAQPSEDETTALNLQIQMAWGTAATSADVRLFSATMEQVA